jgi:hypothetical protein
MSTDDTNRRTAGVPALPLAGLPVVDTAYKPIETNAEEVVALISRHLQSDAPGDTAPAADNPCR